MVTWTDGAQIDLKEIFDYILPDSPEKALEITDNIFEKALQLDNQPHIGRIVPKYNRYNVREIFIFPYRVIYKINDEEIFILGVHHGKRDLENIDIPIE